MNCFKPQNSEENPLILLNKTTSHQNIIQSKSNNSIYLNNMNQATNNIIQSYQQRMNLYQNQIHEEQEKSNQANSDPFYLRQNVTDNTNNNGVSLNPNQRNVIN